MTELEFANETHCIRGAVFEVYREMGCGFLEAVYHECLMHELTERGIAFVTQQPLVLHYKGNQLEQSYTPDFVCDGHIVVELKAVNELVVHDMAFDDCAAPSPAPFPLRGEGEPRSGGSASRPSRLAEPPEERHPPSLPRSGREGGPGDVRAVGAEYITFRVAVH